MCESVCFFFHLHFCALWKPYFGIQTLLFFAFLRKIEKNIMQIQVDIFNDNKKVIVKYCRISRGLIDCSNHFWLFISYIINTDSRIMVPVIFSMKNSVFSRVYSFRILFRIKLIFSHWRTFWWSFHSIEWRK